MKKANGSGIYGMKRFVRKLNHDLAAVKNALRESRSNGPVEGHINRLKTLKRQMYGRAGFELLRARLLPMARGSPPAPKLRKNPRIVYFRFVRESSRSLKGLISLVRLCRNGFELSVCGQWFTIS